MKDAPIKNVNTEMRSSARIDHSAPIQIKDITSGHLHRAKMMNYSAEGLYFESDSMLNPGMRIYLAMKNSPFATVPDVIEYRRAEILWRQKLKQSFYTFGYGVRLHPSESRQVSQSAGGDAKKELRQHPRKACRRSTLLATQDAVFAGEIQNISLSGAFIQSEKELATDQFLTLTVPGKHGKQLKLTGQVVWCSKSGCGIKIQHSEQVAGSE
jgi:Tfp pilus assembly protein PilZ